MAVGWGSKQARGRHLQWDFTDSIWRAKLTRASLSRQLAAVPHGSESSTNVLSVSDVVRDARGWKEYY